MAFEYYLNVSSSSSLSCSLSCIITAYCINHSLDKHNFSAQNCKYFLTSQIYSIYLVLKRTVPL